VHQQKTSLRRYGHTNLVGNLETAASLEAFFGEKYLNVTK
jgi:hypothetical protein